MQNNIWLWIVGVVVVLGIGAYIATQGGVSPTTPGGESNNTQLDTASDSNQPTSLKVLLAAGIAQKCTVSSATANSSSSGTVYLAQGMMRGEFTSVSGGQTVESHMIVKDNTSYVWSDMMPQWFKMSFGAMGSGAGNQGGVDVNAQANYSCTPWAADQGMFELPASVTFMSAPGA